MPAFQGQTQELRQTLSCIKCPLLVLIARQCEGMDKATQREQEEKVTQAIKFASATSDISVSVFEEVCDERRMLNTAQGKHTASVVLFLEQQDNNRKAREETARLAEAEQVRRSRSILAKSEMKLLGGTE